MAAKPCPECGSTNRKQESGEYALMALTGGALQIHLDTPKTLALVVQATVCGSCKHVSLYET